MKKNIIFAVIIIIFLSSCGSIRNMGGGGCGVWMPKKYTGVPKMRGNARIPTF